MGKGRFVVWVSAVFAVLMLTRLSVMSRAEAVVPFGRAGTADLALAVAMITILALTHLRLLQVRLSMLWLLPVGLWLIACEPLMRVLLGGPMPAGSYPGVVQNWSDVPLMLLAFFLFVGFFERAHDGMATPSERRAEQAAALIAGFSIAARPYLVLHGLDRMPMVGEYFSLSGGAMTMLLQFEMWMSGIKGAFFGLPNIGNGLMVGGFCAALVALMLAGRAPDADRRTEMVNA